MRESERDYWADVSDKLMSDEEDGEDGEIIVKTPKWRCEELSILVRRLDSRKEKEKPGLWLKKRVPGSPTKRVALPHTDRKYLAEDSESSSSSDSESDSDQPLAKKAKLM